MLRFHPLEAEAAVPGRRLGEGGMLSGVLHTLGYYSTEVCIGSPPRPFELIVDTGSAITAVPCHGCVQCGAHRCGTDGRFDPRYSRTSSPVTCGRKVDRSLPSGLRCEACNGGRCNYAVNYMEGSRIGGHVQTDLAHFVQSASRRHSARQLNARIYFGCTTTEKGMFYAQAADGILGLQPETAAAPRRSRVPSVLASLVQQSGARDIFSLCLSDTTGLLLLGGRLHSRSLSGLTLPMKTHSPERFTLQLQQIRISNPAGAFRQPSLSARFARSNRTFRSLGVRPHSAYNPTQVDSGTTFVFASTPVFRALVDSLRVAPQLKQAGNKKCGWLNDAELEALPQWQLVFTAQPGLPLLVRRPQPPCHPATSIPWAFPSGRQLTSQPARKLPSFYLS